MPNSVLRRRNASLSKNTCRRPSAEKTSLPIARKSLASRVATITNFRRLLCRSMPTTNPWCRSGGKWWPPIGARLVWSRLRSAEIETVKVHDFIPHCDKVAQELLLGVRASVYFRQGPKLRICTEDQID